MDANLFAIIRERIVSPANILLRTAAGEAVTYGDMLERSGRLANTLVLRGVEPGDRVAVQVEKSPQALMLYLATLRAGAVYVPFNTAYTLRELDYFLADATPKLMVCDPTQHAGLKERPRTRALEALETLDAAGQGSLSLAAAAAPADFADVPREGGDLAALLYTSGTTGRSKGAMLTHHGLASNALTLAECWRFSEADVLLHALPIFHSHGLFAASNTAIVAGASMIFLPKFDADAVLRLLPRASVFMGVPTFYTRLLGHPALTAPLCAHMRLFVSGSAPLLPDTHQAFLQRTGHAILESYGLTSSPPKGEDFSNESLTFQADTQDVPSGVDVTIVNRTENFDEGERRPGTVGLPLPGTELRIADPQSGRPLTNGEIGVIEVRGPQLFAGHWGLPEKTQAEFRPDGFFITGDLGKIDSRGYVHIVGRAKDLIISGGFNVYPKEVEVEIDALPGVVESAVVGVPHPDFGEGVTAVVVTKAEAALSEDSILAALAGRLAKFKRPKRVLFTDQLPRNIMGKVQKNLLRSTYLDLYTPRAAKRG
jgi:malonyl-CoA/methylmalonyl-CoA synthetase